jgi:glycosyltransferase involved in cell wall biosynthesis
MNIWIVQIGEPSPNDGSARKMRTGLLTDKLIEKGHSIVWWTSAFDHFKKKWICLDDAEVHCSKNLLVKYIKGVGYRKNISFSRLVDHRCLAHKFKKLARALPVPDLIVASMPAYDLAYEAVSFGKKAGVPVMVDIRDEWPDLFLEYVPSTLRGIAKIFLWRDYAMLKTGLKQADSIIAMTEDLLRWGLNHAERDRTWRDRVYYLGCVKSNGSMEGSHRIDELSRQLRDRFVVTFVGTFVSNNDPSVLLECAERSKDVVYVLAGDGELLADLKARASSLKNVLFTGWLNEGEINALLRISSIGICPAARPRNAFPNKAFTYFSAGIPVASAFSGEMKNVMENLQIGFYYRPGNAEDLMQCIDNLRSNEKLYKRISGNVRERFDELFDAGKIYGSFAGHIENIAQELKSSSFDRGWR